jgi:hypothetical protein
MIGSPLVSIFNHVHIQYFNILIVIVNYHACATAAIAVLLHATSSIANSSSAYQCVLRAL